MTDRLAKFGVVSGASERQIGGPASAFPGRLSDAEAIAFLCTRAETTIERSVLLRLLTEAQGDPRTLATFADELGIDELSGRTALPHLLPLPSDGDEVVDALSPAERTCCVLLLLDRSGRVDVLQSAAGARGAEVLSALESRGVLRMRGNRIVRRNAVVLSEVRRRATLQELRDGHRALAQALQLPEDADLRVVHLVESLAEADETAAVEALAAVARAEQRGGPSAAAELYEAAASLAADASHRGIRLVRAAEAAWQGGAPARAQALLAQASAVALGADARERAARVAGMASLARARPGEAFQRYLDGAAAGGDRAADLVARAAGIAWWEGRVDWAQRAAVSARTLTADTPLAQAVRLAVPASANVLSGDLSAAGADLRSALALEPQIDSLRGMLFLGEVSSLIGDDLAGLRLHQHAAALARRSGDASELPFALQVHGLLLASAGRFWESRANADLGFRAAAELDEERRGPFQAALLAQQYALLGDEDACAGWAAQALARGSGGDVALARWSLGRLDLIRGRAADALARFREVADVRSGHPIFRLYVLPDLIEAASLVGETELAAESVLEFERWGSAGAEIAQAILPRLRGLVAGPGRAGAHYREAVETSAGRQFEHARARLLLGRHLRRVRRRVDSRDELRAALSAFDSLGLVGWGSLARRELRASGETPPGELGAGSLSHLTAQELRVARLAVTEGSNRGAAERLGLSTRTVEYHLAKAYAKLGINSRAELARVLSAEAEHTRAE